MCGIAGLCNWKADAEKNILKMNARMHHRGPDAGGIWIDNESGVAFGHRRLSIVDLTEAGAQPMHSKSSRFVMAFNGEIYNYKEIADRLTREKKVTAFRGSSDTEVLLESFENYGIENTLEQCKGMFAIALYDKKEKILYLMRDRVGEKPLYYGFVNNSFVFASDLGSISSLDGFQNEIDRKVLGIYFIHGYIPAPYSIYESIYKLEPGCVLKIGQPFSEYHISPYWSIREIAKKGEANRFEGSEKEAANELERLLKEAIKGQMVADVPVGAFLSSGIDSTTIVALMQSLSDRKVRSFTIGVEDSKYNEATIAKEIAQHLGTDHTELYITEEDAKKVIPNLAYQYGEPFADSSQIPTYLVSKMTREHVTVSLSGDAGDELFCGYGTYRSVERIWNKMNAIPYGIRSLSSKLLLNGPLNLNQIHRTKAMLLGARNPAHLYELSNEEDPVCKKIALERQVYSYKHNEYANDLLKDTKSNIMLMDMQMYHPDDILVKVDRAGMAVSLESRIPMLDKDVVEFSWKIPIEYKYQDGITKKVLRDIVYQYVPKELLERPKRGFSIPISKWLREPELRKWAETLIDKKTLISQGFLDAEVVWSLWDDYMEHGVWRVQIWFILMFQEWICTREL